MLLRVSEAASLLACSDRTMRRWIAKGIIASVKIGGARRVPESEISRILNVVPDGYWRADDDQQQQ
ncbi:helix-turn-helix domain-containing protein [Rhizobium sp. EC-SD404]|uniref:helix-turn-helix domain-containing protein n=1 Tax=Rhizobium sp. EC-SD404 TaxID=2038389 RepID=UPI00125B9F41